MRDFAFESTYLFPKNDLLGITRQGGFIRVTLALIKVFLFYFAYVVAILATMIWPVAFIYVGRLMDWLINLIITIDTKWIDSVTVLAAIYAEFQVLLFFLRLLMNRLSIDSDSMYFGMIGETFEVSTVQSISLQKKLTVLAEEVANEMEVKPFTSITIYFEPIIATRGTAKKHHLIIGFPCLFLLSEEELKSAIAHELAHYDRNLAASHRLIWRINQRITRDIRNIELKIADIRLKEKENPGVIRQLGLPMMEASIGFFDGIVTLLQGHIQKGFGRDNWNTEIYCDAVAVQYFGKPAFVSALKTIALVVKLFNEYHKLQNEPYLDSNFYKAFFNYFHTHKYIFNLSGAYLKDGLLHPSIHLRIAYLPNIGDSTKIQEHTFLDISSLDLFAELQHELISQRRNQARKLHKHFEEAIEELASGSHMFAALKLKLLEIRYKHPILQLWLAAHYAHITRNSKARFCLVESWRNMNESDWLVAINSHYFINTAIYILMNDVKYWEFLAKRHQKKRNYKKAINYWDAVLCINLHQKDELQLQLTQLNRAACLEGLSQFDEAVQLYDVLLSSSTIQENRIACKYALFTYIGLLNTTILIKVWFGKFIPSTVDEILEHESKQFLRPEDQKTLERVNDLCNEIEPECVISSERNTVIQNRAIALRLLKSYKNAATEYQKLFAAMPRNHELKAYLIACKKFSDIS